MSFVATAQGCPKTWEFIQGDIFHNMSIMVNRFYYLQHLSEYDENMEITLRDPSTNNWTPWVHFPGKLSRTNGVDRNFYPLVNSGLVAAIDVHRTLLDNEIVIESDYPTYAENYDATKIIGAILESKGFAPLYYYSGSKSIHIHCFLSWKHFTEIDPLLQDIIIKKFASPKVFRKKFIKWLRELMISGWDTGIRIFDMGLSKERHMIRSELSRNKIGYKTFIGYTFKDLSFIPQVCNETNRIYPELGQIELSYPHKIDDLIEEFLDSKDVADRIQRVQKKNASLNSWLDEDSKELRPCVNFLLSGTFTLIGDGKQRAGYILLNELKQIYTQDKALATLKEWNNRNGFPFTDKEIFYRFKAKNYSLSTKYIVDFIKEIYPEYNI